MWAVPFAVMIRQARFPAGNGPGQLGKVSLGQGKSCSVPSLACHLPPCLAAHGCGPGPEAQSREQMKSLLPVSPTLVNVCIVGKRSESTHCLCSSVCSLVRIHNCPSRGPLGSISLGCTFVSLFAMKVPGPHWVWFLTSSPLSSASSALYTSGAGFVPPGLPPPPPPFFLPLPYRDSDQAVPAGLSPRPISPLPSPGLPTFPTLPVHFIHSFILQTVLECCCIPNPGSVPRVQKMHWGGPSLRGTNKIITQNCSCPELGIVTELSTGLPEEP